MAKQKPLHFRLYNEPHLIAFVRLIGYDGLAVPEAQAGLKRLSEEFGQDRMKAAAGEIVRIDTTQDQPVVRLTEPVRRLAWQLLGPPPEKAEEFRSRAAWVLPPCA